MWHDIEKACVLSFLHFITSRCTCLAMPTYGWHGMAWLGLAGFACI